MSFAPGDRSCQASQEKNVENPKVLQSVAMAQGFAANQGMALHKLTGKQVRTVMISIKTKIDPNSNFKKTLTRPGFLLPNANRFDEWREVFVAQVLARCIQSKEDVAVKRHGTRGDARLVVYMDLHYGWIFPCARQAAGGLQEHAGSGASPLSTRR
jgi:hypothetical protein